MRAGSSLGAVFERAFGSLFRIRRGRSYQFEFDRFRRVSERNTRRQVKLRQPSFEDIQLFQVGLFQLNEPVRSGLTKNQAIDILRRPLDFDRLGSFS